MPNYCVAVGCKNTAKKGSEYSFHRFPHQNPNLLKKWVHAICRKQWKPTKHSFICSDHFHESCFVIRPGAEGRRLKDDAVPSIFQTFPSYYQKDIKLQRSPRKRQYVAHERKKFHNLKDLVNSLKQQKLVSDAEQHLLEQNFDGVGKYLFENQIANAKQASKQAICHGCGLWAGNTHTYFCANW